MLKKILSLFMVLCLFACGTKEEEKPVEDKKEETTVEKEYIDPVKDIFIFGMIDQDLCLEKPIPVRYAIRNSRITSSRC